MKLVQIVLAVILVTCGGCGSGSDLDNSGVPASGPVDTTSHDNRLNLSLVAVNYTTMSFTETGHFITGGQPWNGVSYTATPAWFYIDVQAGRKGSGGPLTWFNSFLQGGAVINGPYLWTQPTSMNFAVSGVLSIDANRYNICIGQWGHDDRNIWLVGGPGFPYQPEMHTPDGKYWFTPGGSDDVVTITGS